MCFITLRAVFDRGQDLYISSHSRHNKVCRKFEGRPHKECHRVEPIMKFEKCKMTKANLQGGNMILLFHSELTRIVKGETGSCHANTYIW